ncbi:ParB/RepB/Spo0J family partition protein [Actinomyces massiliensis]|nr:ParB/RepB/Spo0J family partition protein [Actinomyces massiliensis]WLD73192.1 ParB/RepB/Spo0J family partition protein [Actinomyces massiliensis]
MKENSDSSASASKKKASTRSKPSKTARSVSRETSAKNNSEKVEKRREEPAQAAPEPEEVPADIKVKEAETVKDGDTEESSLVPVPGATFADLPVNLIAANPHQPRQVFDEDDITELAASIKEVGLLQPIVVRRREHGDDGEADYELIMGERRLRAAKEAGLETIPAVVRYAADEDLLRDALLENLHRVQLNPLEEAAAYQQLLEDFNCTHAELSQRIARSRSQISNTLRLMKLPPLVQRRLAAGVLSAGHARALLGLPDVAAMERIAQRIVAEGLSVRATEELVALHDEPDTRRAKPLRTRSATLPALSTRLSDAFDTRVKVTRGAKKGRITIEFAGDDDLARIVTALAPGTSLDEE